MTERRLPFTTFAGVSPDSELSDSGAVRIERLPGPWWLGIQSTVIELDGKIVARLRRTETTCLRVPAGHHSMSVRFRRSVWPYSLSFDVQAGQEHRFACSTDGSGRPSLGPVISASAS